MTLIEQIRKARRVSVTSHGKRFTVRRPTDLEMMDMTRSGDINQGSILARFVIGWEGFTELDLAPGGTGAEVAFDPAIFAEWIADQPSHWNPLTEAIFAAYKAHKDAQEATGKNLLPGSTA